MSQVNLNLIQKTGQQLLSHPSWDLVLIFLFLAIGFFYGISAGRRRITSALLFTYVAIAIFPVIPVEKLAEITQTKNIFYLKSASFLGVFFILYLLLGSKKIGFGFQRGESWWRLFLLSFSQTGLMLQVFFSFLPPETLKTLAPITRQMFAQPQSKFWWFIIPLAVLFIVKKTEEAG
jgi:hypothetical protein